MNRLFVIFDVQDAKFPHHKVFIHPQLERNMKIKFLIGFAAFAPVFAFAQTALPSGVTSTRTPSTPPPQLVQSVATGVQSASGASSSVGSSNSWQQYCTDSSCKSVSSSKPTKSDQYPIIVPNIPGEDPLTGKKSK